MANATRNVTMTRGDTRTLAPPPIKPGTEFALPIASLEFCASYLGYRIHKEVGDGLTIDSADEDEILFHVDFTEDDTLQLPNRKVKLLYSCRLVESDGNISTPIGGLITVLPTAKCD